jgi:hypothetical protein
VSEGAPNLSATLRPLPLAEKRAVGGAVARGLLAAYLGLATVAWVAATAAAIAAAPDLAAGAPFREAPLVAVHLLAVAALPLAVSGAAFHLLPVMLRNDLPSQRVLWPALILLAGAFPLAAGIATGDGAVVWPAAAAVSAGLGVVVVSILTLVARVPRGRMVIASRVGVALSCAHALAALALGYGLFDGALTGRDYLHGLLIHLQVALIGWIALLVLAVGRTLGPMLALAPAAPARRFPWDEALVTAGLWTLVGGLAAGARPATLAGGALVVAGLGRFAVLLGRTARARRGALEAPLAHLLVGALFLVEAAVCGFAAAAGAGGIRLVEAYVLLLLVGWAGGVVLGHVPKLLSLSIWVWWPPGPRPKQAALYDRRLGLASAAVFAAGVQTLAIGVLAGSEAGARAGAIALLVSAVLTAAGAASTWRRRARTGQGA